MISAGAFELALAELDAVTVPTDTPEATQLAGTLALSRSLLAAVDSRPDDMTAPFEQAVELAERTGESNAYGMGFGPTTVGLWRMYGQLEAGDYAGAVKVGAERWHGCGTAKTMPSRRCVALSRSCRTGCTGILSPPA
jgi:hypothetical protein